MAENKLYYGDNLDVLRRHVKDESVDLVYLDPPFNSNADYNVLFQRHDGTAATAQIQAFEDTWRWDMAAARALDDAVHDGGSVGEALLALQRLLGQSDMMAYLAMMAPRLVELRRVLKSTGSIYLHCDPTAVHYLRALMDAVFGPTRFMSHVVWKRSDTHNDARRQFPSTSDHILLYAKGDEPTFNPQHTDHAEKTLKDWYTYLELPDGTTRRMTKEERETQIIPDGARRFNADNMTSPNPRPNLMFEYKGYPYPAKGWRYSRETMKELDERGLLLFPSKSDGRIMRKRYLDEQKGPVLGDVWTDISQLRGSTAERLGYPTQKPLALLERIVNTSSNPGDIVLDPFCGCGTTIEAAHKLRRRWVGIDVTHLAVNLMKHRLQSSFGPSVAKEYDVVGEPTTVEGAWELAQSDPYQFQFWALGLVGARPHEEKKGADKGIDGRLHFLDPETGKYRDIIISVKAGKPHVAHLRDLRGVVDREKAAIGVLIMMEEPTRPMVKEAATGSFYNSPFGQHPGLQLLTIQQLLDGARIDYPRQADATLKKAPRQHRKDSEQLDLTED